MTEKNKIEELINIRIEKLNKLREAGIDPYPHNFHTNASIDKIIEKEDKLIESKEIISIAGRIVSLRQMGKALFINIQGDMNRLQCYISNKNMEVDEETYKILINNIDICLAAYNKKKEFEGSRISVKEILCKNYEKFQQADDLSKISILNKL